MDACLDTVQYKYILHTCQESKSDDTHMHLSDVGILEHVLQKHLVPSVLVAIYQYVDEIHPANVVVNVGEKRSAPSGDAALLRTPPRMPPTDEEVHDKVLREHWRLHQGRL